MSCRSTSCAPLSASAATFRCPTKRLLFFESGGHAANDTSTSVATLHLRFDRCVPVAPSWSFSTARPCCLSFFDGGDRAAGKSRLRRTTVDERRGGRSAATDALHSAATGTCLEVAGATDAAAGAETRRGDRGGDVVLARCSLAVSSSMAETGSNPRRRKRPISFATMMACVASRWLKFCARMTFLTFPAGGAAESLQIIPSSCFTAASFDSPAATRARTSCCTIEPKRLRASDARPQALMLAAGNW